MGEISVDCCRAAATLRRRLHQAHLPACLAAHTSVARLLSWSTLGLLKRSGLGGRHLATGSGNLAVETVARPMVLQKQ